MRMPLVAAALVAITASAAGATPPSETDRGGRYAMHPVDGGFVRLDTQTGAVSLCTRGTSGFACEAVPDASGQQQEIDRLREANRMLEAEVRRLAEEGGGRREPQPRRRFELPSEQDVDKALDYVERMYKRFRDRIRDLDRGSGRGTPL